MHILIDGEEPINLQRDIFVLSKGMIRNCAIIPIYLTLFAENRLKNIFLNKDSPIDIKVCDRHFSNCYNFRLQLIEFNQIYLNPDRIEEPRRNMILEFDFFEWFPI